MDYYQERNGDYLCVDPDTRAYYDSIKQPGMLEGRACAISNNPSSMCTTSISQGYLNECEPVEEVDVPVEYLHKM